MLFITLCVTPITGKEGSNYAFDYCEGLDSHNTISEKVADDVLSASVTRRQYQLAEGTSPSATFSSAPISGNLLVVIAGHRKNTGTPTISGSGWQQHVSFDVYTGQSNHRRGMTIWTKIAGPNEPSTITTSVGDDLSKVLIQEFSVSGGFFTSIDQVASNQGTTSSSTYISTGTTGTTTNSNTLVIGAMIGRYSAGNTPNFGNGLHSSAGSNESSTNYPTLWSGFVHRTSSSTQQSTVSHSSSIESSAAIIAYGISAGSNGGSGTDCPGRVSSGLIALYDFSEGSGNVVNDISGYGTPLDLVIANTSNTSWMSGDCGLSINSSTLLESSGNASKISTACKATNEYTLEVWAKASNTTQGGPARIVEMGDGVANNRNFMFGPDYASFYESRIRTTSNPTGFSPDLNGGTPNTSLNHFVVTRNSSGVERIYVNGTQVATHTISGNLSNWSDSYTLQVANRIGLGRPWLGELYKIAIYNKDLSSSEITTNYNEGECCSATSDFSDAPLSYGDACAGYQNNVLLGSLIDAEPDSHNNINANGDDNNGVDDDDGVTFVGGTDLAAGTSESVSVAFSTTYSSVYINGWIDFNGDGNFDTNERIINEDNVGSSTSSPRSYSFTVPSNAVCGTTYARFRISDDSGKGPTTCDAVPGEVEDYMVTISGCGSGGGGNTCTLTVRALGSCGGETIDLKVNGVAVATYNLTTSFANYTYSGYTEGQNVSIQFYDANPGCDHNARIDYISAGTSVYEMENASNDESCNTSGSEWMWCSGTADFGNLICSTSGGSSGITCTSGQTVDHYGEGCSGSNININVPNLSNVVETIIELVYKSCDPGSSVTVSSSIGNISVPKVSVPGGSSNVSVYRTVIGQGVTNITATSACGTCGTGNGLQSLLVYAVRNVDTGVSYETTTTAMSDYCGVETISIPISTSTAPRDVTVILPLSEITNDGRYLTVEAESNIGNVSDSETIFGPDLSLGCCFYLMELTLVDVPANATAIDITIYTDGANNPNGSSCGQSYVVGGTTYTEVECSCVDITANAGPNVSICNGDDTTLSGSATGGSGGTTYSWSPATGLSNASIANPIASPTSTTIYTLTVTGSDGCTDTDQMTVTVVNNFTSPGTISGNQGICGSGYDPANIASTAPASGGSGGTAYYVWQKREKPCGGSYGSWTTIPGANATSYNPPAITMTTQYRRLARRIAGCSPAWQYSNVVTKTVIEQFTSAGTISGNETQCGGFDPATITSTAAPSGGCEGSTSYRWQQRTKNCSTGAWTGWANITVNGTSSTYNPPAITVTTQYRRVTWRAGGCTPDNLVSNVIEKTVVEDLANGGTISSDQDACGGFNPTNITGTIPSGACTTQGIDYQWQKREAYGGPWTDISGATGQNYNPPAITVTTQYRRVASTEVCGDLYSNYVTMTVNIDPQVTEDNFDFCAGSTLTVDPEICLSYPDIVSIRPHDNTAWNNQYNQGGNALTGDGKLCFDLTAAPNNSYNMLGLNSDPDANASFTSIDYALYIIHTAGNYRVRPYENGTNRGDKYSSTTSYVGSTFCIERVGTTITYLMDGNLLYTSTIASTADLYFDNSFHSSGVQHAEFKNIQLCGLTSSIDATYSWSTSATTATIDVTNAGTYTVTVTDINGCTDSGSMVVTALTPPSASAAKDGDITCIDGSVVLTASPAGLTYAWSGGGTARTKTVTASGTYTVTVTDSEGCSDTATVTVADNTTPTNVYCQQYRIYDQAAATWSSWVTFSGNCTIELCENGGLDDIQFDGGPNINTGWVWTDEDGNIDSEVDEQVIFSNIDLSDAGTYTGVLTNQYGCVSTVTFDVVVHAEPTVTFNDQTFCQDDLPVTLTPTVSGGSGGYTITWDNGLGTGASKSVSPTVGATTYNITVVDSEGCETIDQATITVNPEPVATPNNNGNICSGLTQTHTATNAGAGATYAWNFGSFATPSSATGIGPHTVTYNLSDPNVNQTVTTTLTVTLNGCTEVGTDVFSLLAIPTGSISHTQPTCDANDGTITISFNDSPNRTGIEFSIDGGTTWPSTASVGDNTGSYTFNNLAPGTYNVWARWGDNSCPIDFGSVTLNPLSSTPVFCERYRIRDAATTTWGPWTNFSGNCTIEICENAGLDDIQFDGGPDINTGWVWTDEDNITDSEVDEIVQFDNIGANDAGTYTGVLTNASGCQSTVTFDVVVNANPNATASNDGPITCADGTVTLTANPSGMTYAWSGGGTGRTKNVTTAGTYTVTVTDANGCSATAQTTVTNNLTAPNADAGSDVTICGGTSTTLTASGGGSYTWSNGSNSASVTVSPTATITYTVTVTAANGCTDTDVVTVTVDNPSATPYAGEDIDICPGETVTLQINEDLGTGNLIDYSGWTTGTGSTTGFSRNGTDAENHRINGTGPWGESTVVWEARPEGNNSSDGGWNTSYFDIDHTKTYRFSVWVNRTVLGPNGRFYLGTAGIGTVNGVKNVVNSVTTTNPYFEVSATPPTDYGQDKWVLVVGHVYPSSHTGTTRHPDSGVYSTDVGFVENTLSDFKWLPETTQSRHRSYLFYSTTTTPRQQWVYPRVDVVDGTEPTIDELLNGYDTNAGLGNGDTWEWYTGSCGGTPVGSGTSITVTPSNTTTYYVRGEGNCGNSACDEVVVTVNTPPSASVTKDGDITCADGTVTLTAVPAGMTYAWSGGGTAQTKDVTTAGTYTVTVTDANGCTDVASIAVVENTTPTNVFCERYRTYDNTLDVWRPWTNFSGNCTIEMCENGGIDHIQFDGGPNINIGWVWTDEDGIVDNEVDEIVQFNNIGANDAGTYTGVLTNEYGCVSTVTFDVVVHANPNATASNDGPITCADGTVTLTANPAGMTYAWSGGGTGRTKNVTSTGTYTVTVTDANGCSSTAETIVTEDILAPTAGAGADQTICAGESATLLATGGGTYSWDNGLGAGATHTVTPASTTTYTVTVTAANGCTDTDQVTITVTPLPQVTITADDWICVNWSENLNATGSGGSGSGYSYAWDNGLGAGSSHNVSPTVTTTYTVTVTDSNGCTNSASHVLEVRDIITDFGSITADQENCGAFDPAILVGTAITTSGPNINPGYQWEVSTDNSTWNNVTGATSKDYDPPFTSVTTYYRRRAYMNNSCGNATTNVVTITVHSTFSATAVNDGPITCADPVVTLTAMPAGMTYSWSNGATTQTTNVTVAGPYTVTVTDSNGCTSTDVTGVVEDTQAPTANAGTDQSICLGASTTIVASGGVSYSWDQGLGAGSNHTINPTTTTTYTVTVTAANGCTDTDQITVTVNPLPTATATNDGPITCADGTVTMTANPAGMTYAWSGGGSARTKDVTTPGTYTVTVTDTEGCSSTAQTIVTEDVTSPIADAGPDQTICAGESATLLASGGGSYSWDNSLGAGATHTVSPTTTTTYTVTVTAANGCTAMDQLTINVTPNPLATPNNNGSICSGDTHTWTAADAGVGASYTWDFGNYATPSSATGRGPHNVTYTLADPNVNQTITATVTVNLNGCTATGSDAFTLLAIPTGSLSSTQPTCDADDGTITISFNDSPNRTGVEFSIDGGSTWSTSVNDNTGSYTFTDLAPSTYDVWVRWGDDSCPIDFGSVTLDPLTSTPVFCDRYRIREAATATWGPWTSFSGDCMIELCENAGLDDIQFDGGPDVNTGWVWTDEDGNIDSEVDEIVQFDNITADDAGTYTGVLTNASGCQSTVIFTVIVHSNPVAVATNDGPITCADGNVTMTATPAGSDYEWSTGATTQTVDVMTAGTYTVTVTNVDGCSSTAQTVVTEDTTPPIANAGPDQIICSGANAIISASGGNSYEWDNGVGLGATHTVSPSVTTTYTVTVTDPNGCTDTDDVTITIQEASVLDVIVAADQACDGSCLGEIKVLVDHALTGDFNLSYDFEGNTTTLGPFTNSDTISITNLCAGSYSNITATNISHSCTDSWSSTIIIKETGAEWEHVSHDEDVSNCSGACDGSIIVDANYALTGAYFVEYTFNGVIYQEGPFTSAGDVTISGLCAGDYSDITIVSQESGCTDIWATTISIKEPRPEATIVGSVNDDCLSSEGEFTVNVTGGSYPYTIDWSSQDGTQTGTITVNGEGNHVVDGLLGGHNYCISIIDVNGCEIE